MHREQHINVSSYSLHASLTAWKAPYKLWYLGRLPTLVKAASGPVPICFAMFWGNCIVILFQHHVTILCCCFTQCLCHFRVVMARPICPSAAYDVSQNTVFQCVSHQLNRVALYKANHMTFFNCVCWVNDTKTHFSPLSSRCVKLTVVYMLPISNDLSSCSDMNKQQDWHNIYQNQWMFAERFVYNRLE